MPEADFPEKKKISICLLCFLLSAWLGLYSLFFFSCLLHSLSYPWQFSFSFIACIIYISLSHPFLEIAVQPLVLFLSQNTYFLLLFSALSFPTFLLQFTLGELLLPNTARQDLPLGNCKGSSVSTDSLVSNGVIGVQRLVLLRLWNREASWVRGTNISCHTEFFEV